MTPPLRMLDLFSGLGGASAAMTPGAWQVTRVESNPRFSADHRDVQTFRAKHGEFDLIWGSPPCTEFARESMPWHRTGSPPSLSLLMQTVRIIQEASPRFWVIENVRGSLPWFRPILGEPMAHVGSCFLWGVLPPGLVWPRVAPHKGAHRAPALRSKIPSPISETLARAVESALLARAA